MRTKYRLHGEKRTENTKKNGTVKKKGSFIKFRKGHFDIRKCKEKH